jgi:hypothetical protein
MEITSYHLSDRASAWLKNQSHEAFSIVLVGSFDVSLSINLNDVKSIYQPIYKDPL